jgi:hypothetical protein
MIRVVCIDLIYWVPQNSRNKLAVIKITGKNVFKKSIFFFVEDMDLFVTLNVATFKNIPCIPIICKYFIFVVSMEMREKNQFHVAIHYLR